MGPISFLSDHNHGAPRAGYRFGQHLGPWVAALSLREMWESQQCACLRRQVSLGVTMGGLWNISQRKMLVQIHPRKSQQDPSGVQIFWDPSIRQTKGQSLEQNTLSSISPAQYPNSWSRDTASVGKLEHVLLIFNTEPLQELPVFWASGDTTPSNWAHPQDSPKSTFFWDFFLLSPTQS